MEGILPPKKKDVAGAVIGTASFDWKKSESVMLPGAICEHLTSFGGVMSAKAGQTPLSEFLRHGAAGSSGTVTEPYAIPMKFPSPKMHVHYARGCTLAEAFYQSVPGPFHLLIVGDPLCRPWARIPEVTVGGIPADKKVQGTITLTATASLPEEGRVKQWELFVDGKRKLVSPPGEPLQLDTSTLRNGPHELRVIAEAEGPAGTRGRQLLRVVVQNAEKEN